MVPARTSSNPWVEFFLLLRGKGATGAFVDGFLNLAMAGIIIAFHPKSLI